MKVSARNEHRFSFSPILFFVTTLLALAVMLPGSVNAQTGYKLQRLLTQGQDVRAMTVGPDGLLYIAVGRSGIEVRTTAGQLVNRILTSQIKEGFLPTAMQFDRGGDLHVLDFEGTVARFRNGALLSSFSVNTYGASENMVVLDMAVAADGSYFFVTEEADHLYALQKHDASGKLLFFIPVSIISGDPTANLFSVALSARGDVHVTVGTNTNVTVEVFSPSGRYMRRLQMPSNVNSAMTFNVVTDHIGNIVVNSRLHTGEPVLVTYSPEGSVLKKSIGGFTGPITSDQGLAHFEQLSGIAFDRAGNLYTSSFSSYVAAYKPAPNARIFFQKVPESPTRERAAEFMFATDTSSDRFECSLDGAPFTSCSSPKRYSGLRLGNHIFRVRVRGNNLSTEAQGWTVQ